MNQNAKNILRPLYVWAFIEALIFWYAIEKLLWSSAGITFEQIVVLGVIAQSSQVLIEVPSSIIADRWSRRKTLMISSVFMLVAIVIVLSVQSFLSFAIMSLMWAFYYAFQSGTINAYIYDLLKEKNEQSQYRKAVSRYATFQLSGLLVSSIGASILVKVGNYFTPYWVTIIPSVSAIIILWRMHEPIMEKTEQSMGTAIHHVSSAARNVLAKKWIIIVFVSLALAMGGRFIWYEYYQLYSIDQLVPAVLFGFMLAMIHVGNILGAEFAHRVKNPNTVMMLSLGLLFVSNLSLLLVNWSFAIIIFLTMCFFGSQAVTIVLDENLQHETDSELRATTLSLMGLASRIVFGIGALAIIIAGSTSESIALTAFAVFVCVLLYIPISKRLVSAK